MGRVVILLVVAFAIAGGIILGAVLFALWLAPVIEHHPELDEREAADHTRPLGNVTRLR